MKMILRTQTFVAWVNALRDDRAAVKIGERIERMARGNPGDVAPVGEGVSEARIHYGPGYRLYFIERGSEIIILLCGGDKGSQSRDIARAKILAKEN